MKFDYIHIIIFRKVGITSIFSFLVCKKYKLLSHFINLIVKFWGNMYFEKCSHIIQMHMIAECHVLAEHLICTRSRPYMHPNSEDNVSAFGLKIKTEGERSERDKSQRITTVELASQCESLGSWLCLIRKGSYMVLWLCLPGFLIKFRKGMAYIWHECQNITLWSA